MSQFDAISTIFLELTSPYYEPVIEDHGTEVSFRYRTLGAWIRLAALSTRR